MVSNDIPDNSVVVGNLMRIISTYDQCVEKNLKKMQEVPVLDLYPKDIMTDWDIIEKLKDSGIGYVL